MKEISRSWKEKLRRYGHILLMVLILLVLTVPELENAWTRDPCALQEMDQDFLTTHVYQRLSQWALHFKPSPPPSVVIVYIDPRTEPPELLTNTCLARVFLGKLVDDISGLGAKAIVIDKFYSKTSCSDDTKNGPFKTAMTNKTIPIVVGQPTHLLTDAKGSDKGCLALSPQFDFGGQKVKYGLTRLNNDVLKLPLRWPVFRDSDDPKVDKAINDDLNPNKDMLAGDTISLVAARQIDPAVDAESDPVAKLIALHVHPYTSFLDLPSTNAMAVRCSTEQDLRDANNEKLVCPDKPSPRNALGPEKVDLAGKIVVIGDLSDQDMQPFPDEKKERPGVYLQANYLQSILDRRFLQEIPWYVTLIGLFVFIVAIYCLHFFVKRWSPTRISLAMLAVTLLICLVALVWHHYYTPLWALWTAATVVAVRSLESKAHELSGEFKKNASHSVD
jgi:hypothetical protein